MQILKESHIVTIEVEEELHVEEVEVEDKVTPQVINQLVSYATNMVTLFLNVAIILMKTSNLLQLSLKLKDMQLLPHVMLIAQIIKTHLHPKHHHILHIMNN